MAAGPYAFVTNVNPSAIADVNGVLYGARWLYNTITYSFPVNSSQYNYSLTNTVFGFDSQQVAVTRWALDERYGGAYSVEGFTALNIFDAGYGNANGTLRFANKTDIPTAYSQFPIARADAGDTMIGPNVYSNSSISEKRALPGSYHYATILHETGHALGLKHPHEFGRTNSFPGLNINYDFLEYTVMSYRSYLGDSFGYRAIDQYYFPQTFMMLDIRALQYLYGVDYTARSENTTYQWDGQGNSWINGVNTIDPVRNVIFQTIWDGNGIDLYDLRNYNTNMLLDLRPSYYTNLNTQRALLDGQVYAKGNIYNALQVGNDNRSLIENAWAGTGNDRLIGNQVGNYLWGNAGRDTLEGGAGNDTLDGGAGQDFMWGGAGNDRFVFRSLADYQAGAPDVINDMSGVGTLAGDRIDISQIDANLSIVGNQAFVAGRTSIGGMATYNNGSYTEVRLFVDSRAGADFFLWINDGALVAANYSRDDFFL